MPDISAEPGMNMINTGQAIRDGLLEAAIANDKVIFFAEGVDDPTAVFGTLKDIGDSIGDGRMIEMPVAENGLVGVAIGAAMAGHRPVVSFHRVEFALLAMEQIVNNAAKTSYLSQGRDSVPLVIRVIVGRGWGQGPNHGQSLESVFSHFPGLKVILPTYPADAKGMITAAVEDNNPVICIENRWCHYVEGLVPDGYHSAPLDGPKVVREGTDATIVAASYMTLEAVLAAEALAEIGVEVEVMDLRVSRPLVLDTISQSLSKTGHLLTVDLGWRAFGIGSEIVSEISELHFDKLKAPPRRLGLPDHPTPSSRGLIDGYYPDAMGIALAVSEMLSLSDERVHPVIERLKEHSKKNPIDIPHPTFKGPF